MHKRKADESLPLDDGALSKRMRVGPEDGAEFDIFSSPQLGTAAAPAEAVPERRVTRSSAKGAQQPPAVGGPHSLFALGLTAEHRRPTAWDGVAVNIVTAAPPPPSQTPAPTVTAAPPPADIVAAAPAPVAPLPAAPAVASVPSPPAPAPAPAVVSPPSPPDEIPDAVPKSEMRRLEFYPYQFLYTGFLPYQRPSPLQAFASPRPEDWPDARHPNYVAMETLPHAPWEGHGHRMRYYGYGSGSGTPAKRKRKDSEEDGSAAMSIAATRPRRKSARTTPVRPDPTPRKRRGDDDSSDEDSEDSQSDSESSDSDATPPRGPGRPRRSSADKAKEKEKEKGKAEKRQAPAPGSDATAVPKKRGPGRPRKHPPKEQQQQAPPREEEEEAPIAEREYDSEEELLLAAAYLPDPVTGVWKPSKPTLPPVHIPEASALKSALKSSNNGAAAATASSSDGNTSISGAEAPSSPPRPSERKVGFSGATVHLFQVVPDPSKVPQESFYSVGLSMGAPVSTVEQRLDPSPDSDQPMRGTAPLISAARRRDIWRRREAIVRQHNPSLLPPPPVRPPPAEATATATAASLSPPSTPLSDPSSSSPAASASGTASSPADPSHPSPAAPRGGLRSRSGAGGLIRKRPAVEESSFNDRRELKALRQSRYLVGCACKTHRKKGRQPTCEGGECACALQGVQCQDGWCFCSQASCVNPYGRYRYDYSAVMRHRRKLIAYTRQQGLTFIELPVEQLPAPQGPLRKIARIPPAAKREASTVPALLSPPPLSPAPSPASTSASASSTPVGTVQQQQEEEEEPGAPSPFPSPAPSPFSSSFHPASAPVASQAPVPLFAPPPPSPAPAPTPTPVSSRSPQELSLFSPLVAPPTPTPTRASTFAPPLPALSARPQPQMPTQDPGQQSGKPAEPQHLRLFPSHSPPATVASPAPMDTTGDGASANPSESDDVHMIVPPS